MTLEGLGYSFDDNICGWVVMWVSECKCFLIIMTKYTANLKKKEGLDRIDNRVRDSLYT